MDPTCITIDLVPIIAVFAVHSFHAIPVAGSIVALMLQYWRQRKTVKAFKSQIVEELKRAFGEIPSRKQAREMEKQIQAGFDVLRDQVTAN